MQLPVLHGLCILPGSAWDAHAEGTQQPLSQHLLQEICPPQGWAGGRNPSWSLCWPWSRPHPPAPRSRALGLPPCPGGLTHALGEINKHAQKKAHPCSSSMNHGSACLSNALFSTESVLLCRLTRAEIKSDGLRNATALRNYKAVLL